MEGVNYKIYERDIKGSLKYIGGGKDPKVMARKFEMMEGSVHFDLVLIQEVADERKVLAVRHYEKANLEYIDGLLANFGLSKEQKKEVIKHVKMYKYRKCDELKATAKLYADRYINMPDDKRASLVNQLNLLPHPQD